MNRAPELKKGPIVLRLPKESDILIREKLGYNEECVRMIGGDFNKIDNFNHQDAEAWYARLLKHSCKWIIEYQGRFVGVTGLRPYVEDNKAKFSIELYDQTIYGKGIGTRVTEMVLDYAFNTLQYHKVFLRVLDYNHRAKKCYERCGFLVEGIDKEGARINNRYYSDIYMGILASDYKKTVK